MKRKEPGIAISFAMFVEQGNAMKLAFALFLTVLLPLTLGCGSDRPDMGTVTGTVTFNGKPLPNADISFEPKGKRFSFGKTDEEGRYEMTYIRDVKGVAVGECIVRITLEDPNSPGQFIPLKYNANSELRADVKPGKNTFDFPLKSR